MSRKRKKRKMQNWNKNYKKAPPTLALVNPLQSQAL